MKLISFLIAIFVLAGCFGTEVEPTKNLSSSTIQSGVSSNDQSRDDIPFETIHNVKVLKVSDAPAPVQLPTSALTQQVNQFTDFSFDLLRNIASANSNENILISPHSILSAMTMTYAGARNETATEFENLLGYTAQGDSLQQILYSINQALIPGEYSSPYSQFREEGATEETPFTFSMVNSVWGEQTYPWALPFINSLSSYHDAGLNSVDFKNNFEQVRLTINDWVESETNNRIKELLPENILDSYTRMVLVNAIYLQANWLHDFDTLDTKTTNFILLDGSTISVPTMTQRQKYFCTVTEDYTAIRLPYVGNEYSMLVYMPQDFQAALQNISVSTLASIRTSLQYKSAILAFPKFSFEYNSRLKTFFTAMGMQHAFSETADFSGMNSDGNKDLYISEVIHKTFIKVNEKGTEAAAATAVLIATASAPSVPDAPIPVTINKPFLFMIEHNETGTILFAGQVTNPLKE